LWLGNEKSKHMGVGHLKPHDLNFWWELGVNPNEMRTAYERDSVGLIKRFKSSSLITERVLKTISNLTGHITIEELAIKQFDVFQELWCLWKFYNNRRRLYLIAQYANRIPTSIRNKFSSSKVGKQDKFNLLLLILYSKDNLLKEFMLLDSIDIHGFEVMQIRHDSEEQLRKFPGISSVVKVALLFEKEREKGHTQEMIDKKYNLTQQRFSHYHEILGFPDGIKRLLTNRFVKFTMQHARKIVSLLDDRAV